MRSLVGNLEKLERVSSKLSVVVVVVAVGDGGGVVGVVDDCTERVVAWRKEW